MHLIGVRPISYIMMMKLIGKNIITEDVHRNMTYAEHMDITADSKHEETLDMWKKVLKKPHDTM